MGSFLSSDHPLKVSDYLAKIFPVRTASAINKPMYPPTPGARQAFNLRNSHLPNRNLRNSHLRNSHLRNSKPQGEAPQPHRFSFPLGGHRVSLPQTTFRPATWLNAVERAFSHPQLTQPTTAAVPISAMGLIPSTWNMSTASDAPAKHQPSLNRSGRQVKRLSQNLSRWSQELGRHLQVLPPSVTVVRAGGYTASRSDRPDEQTAEHPNLWQCLRIQRRETVRATSAQPVFQVRVKRQLVAELPTQAEADVLAAQLVELFKDPDFKPTELQPALIDSQPAGRAGETVLFSIDQRLEEALDRSAELIAIDWINNLRLALEVEPLDVAQAQIQMHQLTATGEELVGTASWYGPYFHGRLTAAGETFNQDELTAAHPSLPFDTYLKVTNLESGNSVVVRINDRGPYVGSRSLDLSNRAARCLDSEDSGVVPYQAVIMEPTPSEEFASQPTSEEAPRIARQF